MSGAATPEAVMAAYAELINQHDFALLIPLIDPAASFWFSSGTYQGHNAVHAAFERAWQRLGNETYWLEDLTWIARGRRPPVAPTASTGALPTTATPPKAKAAEQQFSPRARMASASSMNT